MVKKAISKKITRKVISKPASVEESTQDVEQTIQPKSKRGCIFCQTKKLPLFTDAQTLRKFLTDRGKIMPKVKTSLCSKHQRLTTKQIKYARHLALLPFTPKV